MTEPAYIAFVFDSEYCVCSFLLCGLRLGLTNAFPGVREFTRTVADTTTQNQTLHQVQVEGVGILTWRYAAVVHLLSLKRQMVQCEGHWEARDSFHPSSDRGEFSYAM